MSRSSGKTTHVLQHMGGAEWELRRHSQKYGQTLLTGLRAASLEVALHLADKWLHENEVWKRGHRWVPSKGWTGRYVLRT